MNTAAAKPLAKTEKQQPLRPSVQVVIELPYTRTSGDMNPNEVGVICAAGAIVAFFLSYILGRKIPAAKRGWLALLALVLALPGASFSAYYAHLVEVPEWYYEFRSWRGTEGLLVFIGVAGGLIAASLGAVFRILPLLGVVAFVSVPFVKPFLGPFPDGALRDLWSGEVCLQSTYSTCGAAAAASLLRKHGLAATEAEIAREAYSYQGGTEVWYLARAVRRRGLKATMHVREGLPDFFHDTTRSFMPCIVGVKFGGTGHFIALLSRDGDEFHVGDPLRGSEMLDVDELRDRYQYSGFWMEVWR